MSQRKPRPPTPGKGGDQGGIVGDWIQNNAREGGALEVFSKFSCVLGWGIGGDFELH